jgi:PTS system glucitol/sorbitol-specific IIC component
MEREEEASLAGAGSLEKAVNPAGSEIVDSAKAEEPIASSVLEEGSDPLDNRKGYHTITITRGDGGYGGPLTITPTEERHIVLYMTGGGLEPEPLAKIVSLSGMEPVNGNQETCPDEEVALAIIDCGGTLRCGIYPGKGIPTVNILATGKSGPLAKYMTEDMYVSAVTSECVSAVVEDAVETDAAKEAADAVQITEAAAAAEADEPKSTAASEKSSKMPLNSFLEPVLTISKVISLFQQSAREAVKTCLEMILPFMGFAALFIGICKGSGLTQFLAGLIQPMGGSLPGLLGLGIICSIPGLSAILGAGAVAAQMFSTVIGELIAAGSIPPAMALPALFAINCQCACDFIPVGLGMTEAKPETTQVGIASITISRFATGWFRILIAVVFSIGLYK